MSVATDNPPAAREAAALAPVNGDLSSPLRGRPEIAKALAAAQKTIRRVSHDAENAYHKYAYTSSEAVIEAAKDALADNGLAVLPLEETLSGWEREGENRFELVCKFLLIHSSGETAPLLRHWPVCPDKGRPLDKATAAASTLALSYLLRDLCLIPRVNPADDVNARDDRQQPAAKAPKPAKAPNPLLPADGAELLRRLTDYDAKLAGQGLCAKGDLLKYVSEVGRANGLVPELARWGPGGIKLAVASTKDFEAKARERQKAAATHEVAEPPAEDEGADFAIPEHCRAIWNQARASKWKTAVALLSSLGVVVPDEFQEPLSDQAAGQMAGWLTAADAKRALLKLADAASPPPKG